MVWLIVLLRGSSTLFAQSRGNDGLKDCAYDSVLRPLLAILADDVPDKLNRLAAHVGGDAALAALPLSDLLAVAAASLGTAKAIAGHSTARQIDLAPLFRFVCVDVKGERQFNFLGAPDTAAAGHAIVTCSVLRFTIAPEIAADNDVDRWWKVFTGERRRVLTANVRGARLHSLHSATTDGTTVHFLYSNLNCLNRCDDEHVDARGLVQAVLYNFRSYKALLPLYVQRLLVDAESHIKALKVCCVFVQTLEFDLVVCSLVKTSMITSRCCHL